MMVVIWLVQTWIETNWKRFILYNEQFMIGRVKLKTHLKRVDHIADSILKLQTDNSYCPVPNREKTWWWVFYNPQVYCHLPLNEFFISYKLEDQDEMRDKSFEFKTLLKRRQQDQDKEWMYTAWNLGIIRYIWTFKLKLFKN